MQRLAKITAVYKDGDEAGVHPTNRSAAGKKNLTGLAHKLGYAIKASDFGFARHVPGKQDLTAARSSKKHVAGPPPQSATRSEPKPQSARGLNNRERQTLNAGRRELH